MNAVILSACCTNVICTIGYIIVRESERELEQLGDKFTRKYFWLD